MAQRRSGPLGERVSAIEAELAGIGTVIRMAVQEGMANVVRELAKATELQAVGGDVSALQADLESMRAELASLKLANAARDSAGKVIGAIIKNLPQWLPAIMAGGALLGVWMR